MPVMFPVAVTTVTCSSKLLVFIALLSLVSKKTSHAVLQVLIFFATFSLAFIAVSQLSFGVWLQLIHTKIVNDIKIIFFMISVFYMESKLLFFNKKIKYQLCFAIYSKKFIFVLLIEILQYEKNSLCIVSCYLFSFFSRY